MTIDRRATQRICGPFDGTWSGAAVHRTIRIADFSVAGCFVEDLAAPAVGESVSVTLRLPGDEPIEVGGRVVYLYPSVGFAVAFESTPRQRASLESAVARLAPAVPGP